MAFVAVDKNGKESICEIQLLRQENTYSEEYKHKAKQIWVSEENFDYPTIELPKGSIEKLIGKKLTWEDEPVELKEEK